MLGKVKRGLGWRWGGGTGGPGTGGRPPVGPVKKGAPGPENPGLRGTLGGGGGLLGGTWFVGTWLGEGLMWGGCWRTPGGGLGAVRVPSPVVTR